MLLPPKILSVDPTLTDNTGRVHVTGKTCLMCGVLKLLEGFHKNPNTLDGRVSYCRPCACERERRRRIRLERAQSKGRRSPMLRNSKPCKMCGETHGLGMFYKSRVTLDGRCTYCKNCARKRARSVNKSGKYKTRDRLQEHGALSDRTRYILEELGEDAFIRMVARNRFPELPADWVQRRGRRKRRRCRGRPVSVEAVTNKIQDGQSARRRALQFRRGLLESMGLTVGPGKVMTHPIPIGIEPVAEQSAYDRLYGQSDQE